MVVPGPPGMALAKTNTACRSSLGRVWPSIAQPAARGFRSESTGKFAWEKSACADASYFNIHATPTIETDGAAAARAVCCLELVKPA